MNDTYENISLRNTEINVGYLFKHILHVYIIVNYLYKKKYYINKLFFPIVMNIYLLLLKNK